MGLGQIALGIGHVVNDLSLAFGIPYDTAKEFFIQFSNMNFDADANSEFIQVPISKTQVSQVTKDSFATVIEALIREIIQFIRADVQGKGLLSLLGYGVVLTGGGAKLRGLTSIVQEIFSTRAFVGEVRNYEGNTEDMGTEWAVPIGALELGKSFYMIDHYQDSSKRQIRKELHSALGLLKRAIKL